MKSAVIKFKGINEYIMLLPDKTVIKADDNLLREFLTNFKNADTSTLLRNGTMGKWTDDDPTLRKARNYAYITDDNDLVILDFEPFMPLFRVREVVVKMMSPEDYAKKHGKSKEQVKALCQQGRIQGAYKINSRSWVIPENAPYPEDNRLTAGGKYIGVNRGGSN